MSLPEDRVPPAGIVIRALGAEPPARELEGVAQVLAQAYPIMGLDSLEKVRTFESDLAQGALNPHLHWIVAEKREELAAVMALYDFTMNVRGIDAKAGGVGSLAVALAYKRQGVARTMIAWYLEHYRARGTAFAVLHSFRPDFYRKLGFGYGTPVHRYRFAPDTLRTAGGRGIARLLEAADLEALMACSERVRERTNGLIAKHRTSLERALNDRKGRYVGIDDEGMLRAFMQTTVVLGPPGQVNANALVVRDLHAQDDSALAALLAYLHAQRDQFAQIVIESQDDALFLAAADPRDGSNVVVSPPAAHRIAETGLGAMYRLLDIPGSFAHLGSVGAPFTLRLEIDDDFFASTAGAWTFGFSNSEPPRLDFESTPDAVLRIGCADLASLVVGSLGLRALVRHRLAVIEPAAMLATVADAFAVDAAPVCLSRF